MEQLSLVPVCPKCGGLQSQVKAKESPKGWRWRCRPCQSTLNKQWRQQVDWNRIERERYAADEARRCSTLERNRQWRQANPETLQAYTKTPARREANKRMAQNANLKALYGITIEEYEQMLERQGGKCAICGRPGGYGKRSERLCVDHCHETGELRSLLCKPCNTGLGCFSDNTGTLEAAVEYLKRHAMGAAAARA
jgi:hypothetical protein